MSLTNVARDAMAGGGLGVKLRPPDLELSSGDWTTNGRKTDPMNVTIENMRREREPMRPMSPRGSSDSAIEASGW